MESESKLIFITGGARSGKSRLAEELARRLGNDSVAYLATMEKQENDPEGIKRIEKHRQRRPSSWTTVESHNGLCPTLDSIARSTNAKVCLIDCMSLYVSNLLLALSSDGSLAEPLIDGSAETKILNEVDDILNTIARHSNLTFIVVSNEVGCGIVPENRLARTYRDVLGFSNQKVAAAANEVWVTFSGLQLQLK